MSAKKICGMSLMCIFDQKGSVEDGYFYCI